MFTIYTTKGALIVVSRVKSPRGNQLELKSKGSRSAQSLVELQEGPFLLGSHRQDNIYSNAHFSFSTIPMFHGYNRIDKKMKIQPVFSVFMNRHLPQQSFTETGPCLKEAFRFPTTL